MIGGAAGLRLFFMGITSFSFSLFTQPCFPLGYFGNVSSQYGARTNATASAAIIQSSTRFG